LNALVLLPFAVLAIPIIPVLIEIFRRKDKGPRQIPEQTLYGDRTDVSELIPPLERARAKARVKSPGEIIRVVGDIAVPSGAEIRENIVVHGKLKLGSKCHIHGSIKALGEVEVGEASIVEGHIISEGRITIRQNATVNGIVDSAENIVLEENAVAEAVSTEKSVRIAPGAKINRRISAGAHIITTPPPVPAVATEEHPLSAKEGAREVREVARRTAPSFDLSFEEERHGPAVDETKLEDLTPTELEIYKLAISGCHSNEIGLRVLMDPVQVQEVVNSLTKRSYLDKGLKPVMLGKATPTIQQSELKRGDLELEELTIDETFERLLASKLHTDIKKGLKDVKEEFRTEADDRGQESATKIEVEEIPNEWRRASSLLFEKKEKERGSSPDGVSNLSQNHEGDSRLSDIVEEGPQEKKDGSPAKSRRSKYLKASLPPLTLLAILFSEVAYYNPGLSVFTFLEGVMPSTVQIWMFFLVTALALAITTILYFAKTPTSSELKSD